MSTRLPSLECGKLYLFKNLFWGLFSARLGDRNGIPPQGNWKPLIVEIKMEDPK